MSVPDNQVFFSIVIPTYNRAKVIHTTLGTLAAQSFKNFEVLVIDDGSTDNTSETVSSMNDARFKYFWKENNERGAARNYGAARSAGQFVLFLDSDDFLHPNALEAVYNCIQTEKNVEVLVCGYEIRNPDMKLINRVNDFKENDLQSFIYGNPFACGSVFVHRSVLKKFVFCERRDVSRCEDWEYWIRLAANFKYKVFNRCILYVIDHPQRSIRMYDSEGLIKCKSNAISEAFKDPGVQLKFAGNVKKIKSYSSSYISLHLALLGYKLKTLRYFFNSLFLYPFSCFSRRTFAIMKHLLIKW